MNETTQDWKKRLRDIETGDSDGAGQPVYLGEIFNNGDPFWESLEDFIDTLLTEQPCVYEKEHDQESFWRNEYKALELEFAHRQEEHEKEIKKVREEGAHQARLEMTTGDI